MITLQIASMVSTVCGAVIAFAASISIVAKVVERIHKPQTDQNDRLDSHEDWLKRHDDKLKEYGIYFDNDKKRIDQIENGNKITQQAILALLAHALDPTQIDPLTKAKSALEDYLINR